MPDRKSSFANCMSAPEFVEMGIIIKEEAESPEPEQCHYLEEASEACQPAESPSSSAGALQPETILPDLLQPDDLDADQMLQPIPPGVWGSQGGQERHPAAYPVTGPYRSGFLVDKPLRGRTRGGQTPKIALVNKPKKAKARPKQKKSLVKTEFSCTFEGCTKIYFLKHHLTRHLKTAHSNTERKVLHRCPICNFELRHKFNMKRHIERKHSGRKYKHACNSCDKSFLRRCQLLTHIYEHTKIIPFVCAYCETGFMTRYTLTRHIRTHRFTYMCTYPGCTETFEKRNRLSSHVAQYHPVVYTCDTCGFKTKRKQSLRVHTWQHHVATMDDPPTIYPCFHGGCGKIYYYQRNLAMHIKSAHKNQKFECTSDGCERTFVKRIGLEKHQKTHEPGWKPVIRPKKKDRNIRKDAGSAHSWAAKLAGVSVHEVNDCANLDSSCGPDDFNEAGSAEKKTNAL